MFAIRLVFIIQLLLLALLAGCGPDGVEVVSETDEKQYQLAKDYQRQGRLEEALSAFLRVIDKRSDAAESHLEAAYIFRDTMKNPLRAIYHFERHLEMKPNSPVAERVRQSIEMAQKQFIQQLPAQPFDGELDRIDMMDLINSLQQENNRLKRELVATQQRMQTLEKVVQGVRGGSSNVQQSTVTRSTQTATSAPNPSTVPRNYIVQSGDSLSSISRAMYGTPSRWIDIYQANRDRLSSENALRVGQSLRIP